MCPPPAAISSGVVVAVAEEAWGAGPLQRGAQHLEGLQQPELLPVPLQRRADRHKEEEVSGIKYRVLCSLNV